MSGIQYWTNQPDFRLFKEEDPNNPEWCRESRPLAEWGDTLIAMLAKDPTARQVMLAKASLFDRYVWAYKKAPADHRAETNLDNHPCLHQAFLAISDKITDVMIQAGVPDLEEPPVRIVRVREPDTAGKADTGPSVREEPGIELGDTEDDLGTADAPA